MIINEYSEVSFYFLIHSFGLSISLGMISGGQIGSDTGEGIKVFDELIDELWSSIRDNL